MMSSREEARSGPSGTNPRARNMTGPGGGNARAKHRPVWTCCKATPQPSRAAASSSHRNWRPRSLAQAPGRWFVASGSQRSSAPAWQAGPKPTEESESAASGSWRQKLSPGTPKKPARRSQELVRRVQPGRVAVRIPGHRAAAVLEPLRPGHDPVLAPLGF